MILYKAVLVFYSEWEKRVFEAEVVWSKMQDGTNLGVFSTRTRMHNTLAQHVSHIITRYCLVI